MAKTKEIKENFVITKTEQKSFEKFENFEEMKKMYIVDQLIIECKPTKWVELDEKVIKQKKVSVYSGLI